MHKYQPKTTEELIEAIKKEIYEVQGTPDNPNWKADLNNIDLSAIEDISWLFSDRTGLEKFNGDISKWNVENVRYMGGTFANSDFNGDISKWNVKNVQNMNWLFSNSKFNQDISGWEVKMLESMGWISTNPDLIQNIRDNWDLSNVERHNKYRKEYSKIDENKRKMDEFIEELTMDEGKIEKTKIIDYLNIVSGNNRIHIKAQCDINGTKMEFEGNDMKDFIENVSSVLEEMDRNRKIDIEDIDINNMNLFENGKIDPADLPEDFGIGM